MSATWRGVTPTEPARPGAAGWLRAVLRGAAIGGLVFGGLALLLLLRLAERPLCGTRRPVTARLTQAVCRGALRLMGLRVIHRGARLIGPGALVANHTSWLDIFVLNARMPLYFVSKAEVAGWPGIGWLARATGTVFIRRARSDARGQMALFRDRLGAGHRLLFFPEGTSSDGLRVLPFKTTLFEAFRDAGLRDDLSLQAITVIYHPPEGADPRLYGWWGDMAFGPHLLATLAVRRQGHVEVIWHAPVAVSDFADRKALARYLEAQVRSAHSRADGRAS